MSDYRLGDRVRLRKQHPCGSDTWEILRVGMDFRIRCEGCGRLVLLPRRRFQRAVREHLGPANASDDSRGGSS